MIDSTCFFGLYRPTTHKTFFSYQLIYCNKMSHKGLKLSHVNCRSVFRKLAQLDVLFYDSDVLCCSETWLSKAYPDSLLSLTNKLIYRSDRSTRGGGVCIYIRKNLSSYCKIDVKSTYCSSDLEIVSVDLSKPNMKHIKCCCIYRPPHGDHKKCIDKLTEIMSRRENFKKEIWILGDFNVDFRKRDDINFKRFQNFFKTYGLSQIITDVTRPSNNRGSCIDWIVTNSRFVASANVTKIFLSDHLAIECIRKKAREKNPTVTRNLRDYTNYSRQNLIDLLDQSLERKSFDDIDDPNALWNCIYHSTIDILSVMCPIKCYRQRETPSPWITAEIHRAIRYRDRLIFLFKTTGVSNYLTLARRQRNVVNMLIESAKKHHIERLLTKKCQKS